MKKVNKVVTMVMMGMVIFSMTTCNKEGVYKPKKKISKIYKQYGEGEKELSETWSWDKNKLSRIEYDKSGFILFEYDKNHISKITSSEGSYEEFVYDGSKLSKIKLYAANKELDGSYSFEHDGKKISKMTVEEYYYDGKSKVAEASKKSFMRATLRFILPMQLSDAITLSTHKNRKADQEVDRYTVTFTWKGDNVEEMTNGYNNSQETETVSYTYDKKTNPYCDLFMEMGGVSALSKNNILSERYSNSSNSNSYTIDNSYTYEGNFPKEQKGVFSATTIYGTYSDNYVTYYEYK
jgi:hypothetical protein